MTHNPPTFEADFRYTSGSTLNLMPGPETLIPTFFGYRCEYPFTCHSFIGRQWLVFAHISKHGCCDLTIWNRIGPAT